MLSLILRRCMLKLHTRPIRSNVTVRKPISGPYLFCCLSQARNAMRSCEGSIANWKTLMPISPLSTVRGCGVAAVGSHVTERCSSNEYVATTP